MKNIKTSQKTIYKIIAAAAIILLALCLAVSCGGKKKESAKEEQGQNQETQGTQETQEESAEEKEQVIEYKANSPIGVAESYIGKDVKELIEAVGTLKGDPVIESTNDGGGYQGTYEFDGFTVYTYAKSEDAEAIVTEVVPDDNSKVYKESIKTDNEDSKK